MGERRGDTGPTRQERRKGMCPCQAAATRAEGWGCRGEVPGSVLTVATCPGLTATTPQAVCVSTFPAIAWVGAHGAAAPG